MKAFKTLALPLLSTIMAMSLVACGSEVPAPVGESVRRDSFEMPLPEGAYLAQASEFASGDSSQVRLGSLAPDTGSVQEHIPEIYQRGRLIVGVSQSQNLLSYRNPATGAVEGFEAEIAREIARDIFGNPDAIEFRFINTNTWLSALTAGEVDFVINSISITRQRQDATFFSTPYFQAVSRLLVPTTSSSSELADLAGQKICVTENSTGAQRIANEYPGQDLLVVTSAADCLLALQQNQVSAILSDDAILSGMIAQDPFTTLTKDFLGHEQYGIAFAKPTALNDTTGLIRQVNGTLERVFNDGTWTSLVQDWLGDYLGPQPVPQVHYRAETPLNQLIPETARRRPLSTTEHDAAQQATDEQATAAREGGNGS
ncbi:MAG: glutamate ABC transporter substrate-binding protein [Corynebacterium sp.]|nr:glutamate ABC transporter substrate-binding protein [Corynebacterium sp.]